MCPPYHGLHFGRAQYYCSSDYGCDEPNANALMRRDGTDTLAFLGFKFSGRIPGLEPGDKKIPPGRIGSRDAANESSRYGDMDAA